MKVKEKFLFFDIECSNGYNICSFGYVITDEHFHILKKRDIIINPENKFRLSSNGHKAKIELAYPEEYFYKQDNFSFYYEEIKKLLDNEKYTIFGHSTQSDMYFLNYACERYNLPLIKFHSFDTQKLYQFLNNQPHVLSLEKILDELEINPDNLILHRSCDDAHATMLVAKELSIRYEEPLLSLVQKFSGCEVQAENLHKHDEKSHSDLKNSTEQNT